MWSPRYSFYLSIQKVQSDLVGLFLGFFVKTHPVEKRLLIPSWLFWFHPSFPLSQHTFPSIQLYLHAGKTKIEQERNKLWLGDDGREEWKSKSETGWVSILRGAGESRVGWEETGKEVESESTKEGAMEERLRRIKKLGSILSLVRQRDYA